jgi:thymidylate synthase
MSKHLHELGNKILDEGVWIYNDRTNTKCLTIPIHIATYTEDDFPIDTTRKQAFKAPIMELIGYLRGLTDAQDFADLGAPTWFGNANETEAWLANPNRKGENDMGLVYGAGSKDQIKEVFDKIAQGIDDRGLIINFWKPELFDQGCLRPCLHTHAFQIIGDEIFLTSTQRSADVGLAGSWNAIQCYFLLKIMAHISGLKFGKVTHIIHHPHIYESHYKDFKIQMSRVPVEIPNCYMQFNEDICTLEDLQTWVTKEDFVLTGYEHYEPIKYEFIT